MRRVSPWRSSVFIGWWFGAVVAIAVDEPAPLQAPTGAYEFHAGGAASWVMDGSKPSFAEGGVTAVYESIRIACERIEVIQTLIEGTKVTAPQTSNMIPGPHGPENSRVLLDTRDSLLPRVGFRGLLTPSSIAAHRLPQDPAQKNNVRYHVDLPGAGDFSGYLKQPEGWSLYSGWAERIEIEFVGDIATGTLANLRIARLVLYGREKTDAVAKRTAEINRLRPDLTLATMVIPLTTEQVAGHIDAPVITIDFDAEGRPSAQFENARTWGDPRLINLR